MRGRERERERQTDRQRDREHNAWKLHFNARSVRICTYVQSDRNHYSALVSYLGKFYVSQVFGEQKTMKDSVLPSLFKVRDPHQPPTRQKYKHRYGKY